MTNHPYSNLPAIAFWKTGVAELDSSQIDLAWRSKFTLGRTTAIITLGSCFAQHISQSLKKNGCNWIDAEPAPATLPPAEHKKNNYGVFSFRLGNVYTAALLRQWIDWACGARQSAEYVQDKAFYDPFRPTLNDSGFATLDDMHRARELTLASIRTALKQADLFIFTLGLTEAWLNRDGTIYPLCPGTVRGVYSPEHHLFHNYDHTEIVRDLNHVFDVMRSMNPALRFLLTVSPVPLTATAGGEHVLTATTHSKSVLRSAVGYLARTREDTDYFPSYELITGAPFRGRFFEDNLRSVKPEGVAFVMAQFFRGAGIEGCADGAVRNATTPASAPAVRSEIKAAGDEICDDLLLESWSRATLRRSDVAPGIVLMGDSHMGKMAQMLQEQNIDCAGGGTMNASDWHAGRFDDSAEYIFLPRHEEQRQRWKATFEASLGLSDPARHAPLIVTNIGMQRGEAMLHFLNDYLPLVHGPDYNGSVRTEVLFSYLMLVRKIHIQLICRFLARGYQVLMISDPPVESDQFTSGCALIDQQLIEFYGAIGCLTFNARDWVKTRGGMTDRFRSDEPIHGSDDYYRELTAAVLGRYEAVFREASAGLD